MSDWYQRCARCGSTTTPHDRDLDVCRGCGRSPRSARERLAFAAWTAARFVAVPLAMPALAVLLGGLAALEWAKGRAS